MRKNFFIFETVRASHSFVANLLSFYAWGFQMAIRVEYKFS